MKKLLLIGVTFLLVFSCKKAQIENTFLFEEGMNRDASLQKIILKVDEKEMPLNVAFSPKVYSYNLKVPYKAKSVKLEAFATSKDATVSFNEDDATPSKEGGSCKTTVITCTSSNKNVKKTYIVQIAREVPSKEARAASIALFYDGGKSLPLNEAFYSAKHEYTADVPQDYSGKVEMRLFAYSIYASCKGDEVTMQDNEGVLNGEVKAEDERVAGEKYKVTLKKKKIFFDSDSQDLSIISIEYKEKKAKYKISGNAYTLYVPIQDEKNEIQNGLKVKSYAVPSVKELDSNEAFEKMEGKSKTYIVNVEGKAGKNRNYKLVLVRGEEKKDDEIQENLKLEKMEFSCDGGEVLPIDCKKEMSGSYTRNVSMNIKKVKVIAYPQDKEAYVSVSPSESIPISVGDKKRFFITVQGKNGGQMDYIVVIEKSLSGMVRVISDEVRIPPKQLPYLNSRQSASPYFQGAFTLDNVKMSPYEIGMYEVNYELWYTVREWAEQNGYRFANKGCQGNDTGALVDNDTRYEKEGIPPTDAKKHNPVTAINYRDAIIWCNAYSEMTDLTPVYRYDGKVLKDAKWYRRVKVETTNNQFLLYDYYYADLAVKEEGANGYRLPTMKEWEMAARSGDAKKDEWLYAFPGVKGYEDGKTLMDNQNYAFSQIAEYVWYLKNAGATTHNIGEKKPNSLYLYDMAGNVYEMCDDIKKFENPHDSMDPRYNIFIKGGSYEVGGLFAFTSPYFIDAYYTETKKKTIGFRLARSIY